MPENEMPDRPVAYAVVVSGGRLSVTPLTLEEAFDRLMGADPGDSLLMREESLFALSPPQVIEMVPRVEMPGLRPDPLTPFELVRQRDNKKRKFRTSHSARRF